MPAGAGHDKHAVGMVARFNVLEAGRRKAAQASVLRLPLPRERRLKVIIQANLHF